MILLPGAAAFVLFVLFDMNKIRWHSRLMNLLFAAGGILLALSTVLCIREGSFCWSLKTAAGLLGAAASGLALVYALFFALPFHDTYTEGGDLPVVSQGLYGMCRHPGFWPFLALYLFLWLTFGGAPLAAATVLYPACNGIYIWIQDAYIFPRYIQGYDRYKQEVPFLIPRRKG